MPPVALLSGDAYFYSEFSTVSSCTHSSFCLVFDYNEGTPAFCGLCWLTNVFQDEVPSQIHSVVKNRKTRNWHFGGLFWSHLEGSLGLVAPKEGQSLKQFRLARGQLYRTPAKANLPATHALWQMMGYQPKMAKPLVGTLLGMTVKEVGTRFDLSDYLVHETLGKGVRQALRYIRS